MLISADPFLPLFVQILNSIASFLIAIVTLPLIPLKHLPSKAYVRRMDVDKMSEMKKELKALERELAKAKRRNSVVAGDKAAVVVAPAPIVVMAPPPPPPPKLLPPPPPPPPVAGLKAPAKTWRSSSDSGGLAPTAKPRVKAAVAKQGFDISAAQIASIAGRLRKTSSGDAPIRNIRSSPSKSPNHSPQKGNIAATIRAKLKTRRSSLLQLDADVENRQPGSDGNRSPTHGKACFKTQLRKAPINRSPGGTPYRSTIPSTPPITFNTALADKNLTITPPRPVDAPVF